MGAYAKYHLLVFKSLPNVLLFKKSSLTLAKKRNLPPLCPIVILAVHYLNPPTKEGQAYITGKYVT